MLLLKDLPTDFSSKTNYNDIIWQLPVYKMWYRWNIQCNKLYWRYFPSQSDQKDHVSYCRYFALFIFFILRIFFTETQTLEYKKWKCLFFLNITPLNRNIYIVHIISKTLFLSCPSITEYSYTQFLLHFNCKFLKTLYTCLLPYAESYINTVVWLDYIWRSYYSFSVRIFHQ